MVTVGQSMEELLRNEGCGLLVQRFLKRFKEFLKVLGALSRLLMRNIEELIIFVEGNRNRQVRVVQSFNGLFVNLIKSEASKFLLFNLCYCVGFGS